MNLLSISCPVPWNISTVLMYFSSFTLRSVNRICSVTKKTPLLLAISPNGIKGTRSISENYIKSNRRFAFLLFQSESQCEAFDMKISFIDTQISVDLHVNKTNFHSGFALGLTLKQRWKATRKWAIVNQGDLQKKFLNGAKNYRAYQKWRHGPVHQDMTYLTVSVVPFTKKIHKHVILFLHQNEQSGKCISLLWIFLFTKPAQTAVATAFLMNSIFTYLPKDWRFLHIL